MEKALKLAQPDVDMLILEQQLQESVPKQHLFSSTLFGSICQGLLVALFVCDSWMLGPS